MSSVARGLSSCSTLRDRYRASLDLASLGFVIHVDWVPERKFGGVNLRKLTEVPYGVLP
jgi:hypothetical protein